MSALTWAVAAVVTDDTGRVLLCQQGRGARRYALPGGRLRPAEGPVRAALRDIRAETGWDIELIDLVGAYHLANPPGEAAAGRAGPPPDVLVHVFRARAAGVRPATDPPPGCRLSWHFPDALPEVVTPLTRAAVTDAAAGRSGVLRDVPCGPAAAPPAATLPVQEGQPAAGQGGRPGAGQPPEQRGEAAGSSMRP
ncbi:ADP-ribose pyrophosphatase YjhB (NUDIX family) [Micromonospora violae]|uniref:ADP-ribose pyrophosphatase YjhB (NUDIX family) n=1 Tax=Micromonospora violae TaxID=1278207 RepID=A0A4Q7UIA1_9ACTN|nr:NUDIX hydrolase [Micromonospora violae]RZT80031.1 ADP-ribose pyrophosphatase YjhB (NUDIX family) [Micromonospora violae]